MEIAIYSNSIMRICLGGGGGQDIEYRYIENIKYRYIDSEKQLFQLYTAEPQSPNPQLCSEVDDLLGVRREVQEAELGGERLELDGAVVVLPAAPVHVHGLAEEAEVALGNVVEAAPQGACADKRSWALAVIFFAVSFSCA